MVSFERWGLSWGMFRVDVVGTASFKDWLSPSEIKAVEYSPGGMTFVQAKRNENHLNDWNYGWIA